MSVEQHIANLLKKHEAHEVLRAVILKAVYDGLLPPFFAKAVDPDDPIVQEVRRLNGRLVRIANEMERELLATMDKFGVAVGTGPAEARIKEEILDPGFDRMQAEIARSSVSGAEVGRLKAYEALRAARIEFSATLFNEAQVLALTERSFELTAGPIGNLSSEVIDNLTESFIQGLGTENAALRLNKVFDDMRQYQLDRIARTEINSAQNAGNFETLRENNIAYKMWTTAQDDRVRQTPPDAADHVILHGEVRFMDEPFSNGLMFPLDRSGPPEEVINCRCVNIPYIPREGEVISVTPYYPFGRAA